MGACLSASEPRTSVIHAAALVDAEAAASRAAALQQAVEQSATDAAAVRSRLTEVAARVAAAVTDRRQSLASELAALEAEGTDVQELRRVEQELDELDDVQMQDLRDALRDERRAARQAQQSADARSRGLASAARRAAGVLAQQPEEGSSARADDLETVAETAADGTSNRTDELVRIVEDQCDALEQSAREEMQQRRQLESARRFARQERLSVSPMAAAAPTPLVVSWAVVAGLAAFLALSARAWQRRDAPKGLGESLLIR